MKKTSKTTTSAVAPTKPVAPAPTPKPAAVPKPAVSSSVKRAAADAVAPAPVPKPVPASKSVSTTVAANVNVGFGNILFIRGEGAGLSWDKGVQLNCVSDDLWTIVLKGASKTVVFKLLLNDTEWSLGEDYSAQPGGVVTVKPLFY